MSHAAGAMLTSEDLPETYRNVHFEDADDGRTAEEGPRKKKRPHKFGPGHKNASPSEVSRTQETFVYTFTLQSSL